MKVVGYARKNGTSGKWDSTMLWSAGCVESWGHPTRKAARSIQEDNCRRLGIGPIQWRRS